MIGDIYSESDVNPGVLPVTEEALRTSVPNATIQRRVDKEKNISWLSVWLPYYCYAQGMLSTSQAPKLFLDNLFVGDSRLIGSGTGSRLVREFAALAKEEAPGCAIMHTSWIRLGAINAIEKVFPGQVRVELSADEAMHYGCGTGRSLEQMLLEHPRQIGEVFQAWRTSTKIQ